MNEKVKRGWQAMSDESKETWKSGFAMGMWASLLIVLVCRILEGLQ